MILKKLEMTEDERIGGGLVEYLFMSTSRKVQINSCERGKGKKKKRYERLSSMFVISFF